jgi:hypothetical protein
MLLPWSRKRASSASSSSTSDGASTAVGSSSTSTFAPRASARAISRRCICATASDSVRASGSSARPKRSSSARASALRRARGSQTEPGSPSSRFSATESAGTSMKCWCTMPMPSASAARGSRISTVRPSISIVPESGRTLP